MATLGQPKLIRTNDHRALLESILSAHGFSVQTLMVVPDVFEWAREQGIEVRSPFRCGMAVRDRETDTPHIVLPEVITTDMQLGVVSALEIHFGDDARSLLASPRRFIVHLCLHEISEILHPDRDEQGHDRWAFAQLQRWLAA